MTNRPIRSIKDDLQTLLKDEDNLHIKTDKVRRYLDAVMPDEEKQMIINMLKEAENVYLKAKDIAIKALPEEEDEDTVAAINIGDIKVYKGRSYLFSLPAMKSIRKKEEATTIGKILKAEIISLLEKEKPLSPLECPIVRFVHYVTEEDAERGWIPDPDNLDTSKVIDGLVAGGLLKNDNILSMQLIQEGTLSSESGTNVFVYEEANESDFFE